MTSVVVLFAYQIKLNISKRVKKILPKKLYCKFNLSLQCKDRISFHKHFNNTPEKISDSCVIHTGISDHSLVLAIRKISVMNKHEKILEIRNMKNFNDEKFIEELLKQHWEYFYFFADDPNCMWEIWKNLFFSKQWRTPQNFESKYFMKQERSENPQHHF